MPEIVIDDELLAPDKVVMPVVDPNAMVPSASESETESERPAASGSLKMIELLRSRPPFSATNCDDGALTLG